MLIREKCGIFETAIGDFKPFILDEMKTLARHYQWQGVPYVGDEVKLLPVN